MNELNNKESLRPISMADSEKTATASVNPPVGDTKEAVESVMPSTREQSVEPQGATEVAAVRTSQEGAEEEDPDANHEYPTAWKLTIITIALCLSVFCMALVRDPSRC